MRTVSKLSRAGIYTTIFCMPILPAINSGADVLRPLFEAARREEARNVLPNALYLREEIREPFLSWLEGEFPDLGPLYRRLYDRRSYLPRVEQEKLLGDFRMLKTEYGFERRDADAQKES